ncbi:unnamed protein product [Ranitomeya imitator]|uniref:R-spondin 3 n=1 Tax=Ranitomeya imitator TaxID=111125 RepID=A0ABN9M9E4_9NEOB|nr:unnamed protein product [Ranitomeya imitator]
MKTKEHNRQVRDTVVEKIKAGFGYKMISKTLNIRRSTVQVIILKWKEYHTTADLPRPGHPSKLSSQTRRRLIRVARRKPLLKMMHKKACKHFAEDKQTKEMDYWNHDLWLDETKIKTYLVHMVLMHPNISQNCQGGCATCSDYNGCMTCKPRLFFALVRNGMKQVGVCLPSCPTGYYGIRSPGISECKRCKSDCETCFHKSFCTKCKGGFYLHSGKCLDTCPDGFENNNHSMECSTIVHCSVSEWSSWGTCTKRGKTCGFKRGNETRTRDILQHQSARGIPCPQTSETRKCIVQKKKCSER